MGVYIRKKKYHMHHSAQFYDVIVGTQNITIIIIQEKKTPRFFTRDRSRPQY